MPGVVRAGRPRSQEAFIHTKNREHRLHHAGESGKTPHASLEYHSPLEGESARPGRSPQSSRRGANARLTYKDNLHGWTGYTGWFDESFHRLEFDHHLFFNKDSENPLPSSLMTAKPHRIIAPVSFACSSFPSCLSCLSMFLIMERGFDPRARPRRHPPTASAFAWRLRFCDSPSRGE